MINLNLMPDKSHNAGPKRTRRFGSPEHLNADGPINSGDRFTLQYHRHEDTFT
jgi:hypothetical protein